MKAIILSAGQGKRLLPLTAGRPKCLLEVQGKPVLQWQLDALMGAGCQEVVIVVGYGADQVEELVANRPDKDRIRTFYNPFFEVSNNLASCWVARSEMDKDFLLLNGDVVLQEGIVARVLQTSDRPVTVTIDKKASYDDDDMKVRLDGKRLARIGKDLPAGEIDAESIGLHAFRGHGPQLFREALGRAVRAPGGLERWYLTVVAELARTHYIGTAYVDGLQWAEIDTQEDLTHARALVEGWQSSLSPTAARA